METALDTLTRRLRERPEVAAILVFGSYARAEAGRSSDVDLLILLDTADPPDLSEPGRAVVAETGAVETEFRLPMHLAPLLADTALPEALGPDLLHALWTDAVVLYARAAALAALQPTGLMPWSVFRFSVAHARPAERVRLSRRLHGVNGRGGLICPPAVTLGRGALLCPPDRRQAVRTALDEAGATYDEFTVWRDTLPG